MGADGANCPGTEVLSEAGIDASRGLSFFGQDSRRYLQVLQLFATRRGGDARRAAARLAAGERHLAVRELHSLGVELSMLGAEEGGEVAVAVEWALRNDGVVEPGLDHLEEILQRACAAILRVCADAGMRQDNPPVRSDE